MPSELLISPHRFVTLGLLLALGLGLCPREAGAQVSDADRAAARELATQGIQLQQAGNYIEALDRFDRAQAVFSAPTHLLHIAQCEAALGKLVEASETYRTLVRTPLPAGAPAAFIQAQQQGAAELSQVEPRIPSIRVVIRPRAPLNTTIQIDGQAVSTALVGMQRPTDPGAHTVVLLAPGYARAEQKVVLNERETKDVAFNLGGMPGGYTAPPPAPTSPQASPGTTQPPPPPPPPPPYDGQRSMPEPPRETRDEGRGGFMLGATAGALIPAGNISSALPMNDFANGGFGLGVNAGFRFVRKLYLGLSFEHGFLTAGATLTGATAGGTASADSNYIGFEFGFISHPDGSAFFGKIGAGYRFLDVGLQEPNASFNATFLGGEVSAAIGVQIKAGDWVRIIPLASVSGGQFSSINATGGGTYGIASGSISDTSTHVFVLLGITAFVDFSRKH